MSKIMSMFEKLNLMEKVSEEAPAVSNNETSPVEVKNDSIALQENTLEKEIELTSESETMTVEPKVEAVNNKKVSFQVGDNMTIEEIYSSYGIDNSNINTIFMLGNFINALPENLPYDVKKASVMNIISASNTDLNKLLSDGESRLNLLGEFIKKYENGAVNTVEEYKSEIEKLTDLIKKYKEQIRIKETKLEEQKYIIKYEAEKINSIIDFFTK